MTQFDGAVFGISLLVRDLQGISRNSSRIRQFTPEISIQFQGDSEEFPKRANRELIRANRECLSAYQGIFSGSRERPSALESEQALLIRPAEWDPGAHKRLKGQGNGLGPVEDRGLDAGRESGERDDPGDVAFRVALSEQNRLRRAGRAISVAG